MKSVRHMLLVALTALIAVGTMSMNEVDAQSRRRPSFQRGSTNRSTAHSSQNARSRRSGHNRNRQKTSNPKTGKSKYTDQRMREQSKGAKDKGGQSKGGSDHGESKGEAVSDEYRYSVSVNFVDFKPLIYFDNKDLDPWNEFQLTFATDIPGVGAESNTITSLPINMWDKPPGTRNPLPNSPVRVDRSEFNLELLDPVVDENGELLFADEITVSFSGNEIDQNFIEGPGDPLRSLSDSILFDSQAFGAANSITRSLVLQDGGVEADGSVSRSTFEVAVRITISRTPFTPNDSSPVSPRALRRQNLVSQVQTRSGNGRSQGANTTRRPSQTRNRRGSSSNGSRQRRR